MTERLEGTGNGCQHGLQAGALGFGDFVRKVDRAGQFFKNRGQRRPQGPDFVRKAAAEIGQRGARRRGRLRFDKIGDGRRRVQIHLAVEKRAAGELAGLRHARAARQQRAHDLARDDRRTVRLQFECVFARVAVRGGKKQREPAIDPAPRFADDGCVRRA